MNALLKKKRSNGLEEDDYQSQKTSRIDSLRKGEQYTQLEKEPAFKGLFKCCCKKKSIKPVEDNFENYTEGDSESEFEIPYSDLSAQEKEDRIRYLWHRSFLKAKGAAHILAKFGDLNQKIYLYGAAKKGEEQEDQQAMMLKTKKCVLLPDSQIRSYWNLLITFLLLYTASFVPYRIAFVDDSPLYMTILDTIMDMIFFTDLVLNFFSAYEDRKTGLEVRHK